jgi:phosphoglycolate phosphatase
MALILLDFDGVLADTLDDMIRFGQQTCEELGLARVVTQHDLESLETMSLRDYGRQLGVPVHQVDEFIRRVVKKFNDQESPPRIFEGMEGVCRELSSKHNLAIVTGNASQTVYAFLAKYNLEESIQAVYSVDLPGSKSEKIALACKQLALDGEDVFMLGDAASDIQAARENAIRCIGVSWGHQSVERLMNSNPDFMIHSPGELLELMTRIDKQSARTIDGKNGYEPL